MNGCALADNVAGGFVLLNKDTSDDGDFCTFGRFFSEMEALISLVTFDVVQGMVAPQAPLSKHAVMHSFVTAV